jgi:raffinose/stachyose/melibiose transport system permease protein
LLRSLKNTIIITVLTVLVEIVAAALAAYPLARNRSRFNKAINTVIMG